MSDYRKSEEYQNNQEKLSQASSAIGNLKLDEEIMRAINHLSDVENEISTDYMEQAYIQGICDGIRFVKFIGENG